LGTNNMSGSAVKNTFLRVGRRTRGLIHEALEFR
jgi:hypothetical protein